MQLDQEVAMGRTRLHEAATQVAMQTAKLEDVQRTGKMAQESLAAEANRFLADLQSQHEASRQQSKEAAHLRQQVGSLEEALQASKHAFVQAQRRVETLSSVGEVAASCVYLVAQRCGLFWVGFVC